MMSRSTAGFIFFALSIVWVFLFGAVSISTGELKPRGLFVDENALSVKFASSAPAYRSSATLNKSTCFTWDTNCLCTPYSASPFRCVAISANKEQAVSPVPSVVEISFPPPSQIGTTEATVLAFSINHSHPELWIQDYVAVLTEQLSRSAWTTKSVVVLLIPTQGRCTSVSPALDRWIQIYHSHPSATDQSERYLIRSAFIVDLGSGLGSADLSAVIKWKGDVVVHTAGIDGQLPNMDFVTNLRANQQQPLQFSARKHHLPSVVAAANPALVAYMNRMSALLSHMETLIGRPSGLHHYFLSKNIDSVTISVGDPVSASARGPGLTQDELTEFLMRTLRADQLLHEELHHSFFFYLLMGPNHFVGISEYCACLILAMIPLLLLFISTANLTIQSTSTSFSIGSLFINVILSDLPALSIFIAFRLLVDPMSYVDCETNIKVGTKYDIYFLLSVWVAIMCVDLVAKIRTLGRSQDPEARCACLSIQVMLVIMLIFYTGIQNVSLALPMVLIATPCFMLVEHWILKIDVNTPALIGAILLSPFFMGSFTLVIARQHSTFLHALGDLFQLPSINLPVALCLSQILSNCFLLAMP